MSGARWDWRICGVASGFVAALSTRFLEKGFGYEVESGGVFMVGVL